MICCTIIAFLFGGILYAARKLRLMPQSDNTSPLLWTLDNVEVQTKHDHQPQHFDWRVRARSFRYAFNGISAVLQSEHSVWIHLGAAFFAIGLGIFLEIDFTAWRWITLCIGMVIASEIMNTAIEKACDAITTDDNPLIGQAKDMGAGAVLVFSLSALIIGALTFAPFLAGVEHAFLLDICAG